MIKGERDCSEESSEQRKPCHVVFDLTVNNTSAYNLQAESMDLVPKGATNIRPISEGSVVQETYDFSNPNRPKPIKKIHTHESGEGVMSSIGGYHFPWTTTKGVPMTPIEGLLFRLKHPIIRD